MLLVQIGFLKHMPLILARLKGLWTDKKYFLSVLFTVTLACGVGLMCVKCECWLQIFLVVAAALKTLLAVYVKLLLEVIVGTEEKSTKYAVYYRLPYRVDYGSQDRDEREAVNQTKCDVADPPSCSVSLIVQAPQAPLSLREKRKNNEYESPLSRIPGSTRWT